jgi:hypothetical protein
MRLSTLIATAGLVTIASAASAQGKFAASGRWCGSSPEFRLSAVPKGTAKLDLQMVNLNVPGYPHGGEQVAYQPGQNTIPCSAASQAAMGRFQGASPPPGQVHPTSGPSRPSTLAAPCWVRR